MNRFDQLYKTKNGEICAVYFTAGYPSIGTVRQTILDLQHSGVDLIEIGMPFSDPLADGPVIQESSSIALKNGMSVQVLFDELEHIREYTSVPVVIMGYLNQVMQFGFESFLMRCREVGIDGLILPDLPIELYQEEYRDLFSKYGIELIFLVTPQTPDERILLIDSLSDSFIYAVSNNAITGSQNEISDAQLAYFERIKSMRLRNPVMIGFGISDKRKFSIACEYASGAIIGSAFIRAQTENRSAEFLEEILS